MAGLEERNTIALTEVMFIYLIALEIGLRLLTDGSRWLLAWDRRRRGVESDLGAWRWGASALGLGLGDADDEESR